MSTLVPPGVAIPKNLLKDLVPTLDLPPHLRVSPAESKKRTMEWIRRKEQEIGIDMNRVLKEIEDFEEKSLRNELQKSIILLPSKLSTGDKKLDILQLMAYELGMPLLPLANEEAADEPKPSICQSPHTESTLLESTSEDSERIVVEHKNPTLARLLSNKPSEDPAVTNIANELEEAAVVAEVMLKKCEDTYDELKKAYTLRKQVIEDSMVDSIEARGGAEALMAHPNVNWKISEDRLNAMFNTRRPESSSRRHASNKSKPSTDKDHRKTGSSALLPELDLAEDMISKLLNP